MKITGANVYSDKDSSSSMKFSAKTMNDNVSATNAGGDDLESACFPELKIQSNVAVPGCGSVKGEGESLLGICESSVTKMNLAGEEVESTNVSRTMEQGVQDDALTGADDFLDLLMDNFDGQFDPVLGTDFDPNLLI